MSFIRRVGLMSTVLVLYATCGATAAPKEKLPPTLSKGHRILIEHGLQIQGMAGADEPFHLKTYTALNYTAINWFANTNPKLMGPPPGVLWARWMQPKEVPPPASEMPPSAIERPYASKFIALSLGDEPDLNNPAVRDKYVKWFNEAAKTHPNQILYINNFGGQVTDAALSDFISRAKPDMISWDVYPFRFAGPDKPERVQPQGACPFNWYADLRRYRAHALGAKIPFGLYRQTYHSTTEGVRDPSDSELRQLTFSALAFNAKQIVDFRYNNGASSLFDKTKGGDNAPNALYHKLAQINHEARNLGKALVRLTPIDDVPGSPHTTSIVILRGQHRDPKTGKAIHNWTNGAPDDGVLGYTGFARDPASPDYTDWEFARNDPYLSGPFNATGVTNLSRFNDGLPGDVFLSWFKPLDDALVDSKPATGNPTTPAKINQLYLMVTNALADMDATGAQTKQRIKLNFGGSSVKFPYDHLQRLDRQTGRVVDVPLTKLSDNVRQLNLTLDGGTSELFKFPTGTPFIGVERTR
jgi:hypothetical protein